MFGERRNNWESCYPGTQPLWCVAHESFCIWFQWARYYFLSWVSGWTTEKNSISGVYCGYLWEYYIPNKLCTAADALILWATKSKAAIKFQQLVTNYDMECNGYLHLFSEIFSTSLIYGMTLRYDKRYYLHAKWELWGLLSHLFCYFSILSEVSKYWLCIAYHVHIWQVLLQLSCSDTCQIWTWYAIRNYEC